MKIEQYKTPQSSFMSVTKDTSLIIDAMLKNTRLQKLLHYNTPDALHQKDLTEKEKRALIGKNIKIVPKLYVDGSVLEYIIISFDNFTPSENPQFRDNVVTFDIICHFNQWQLENLELRPMRIAAELDSMFNNKHLTGIGTFQFAGCNQIVINDEFAGVTLMYLAVHGGEDKNYNKDQRDLMDPEDEAEFIKDFNALQNDKEWKLD